MTKQLPGKASLRTALTAVVNPMPFYIINQRLYPDVFRSSLLFFSAYVVHNPVFLRHILQDNYKNYIKGGKYGLIRFILGNGLLTNDGEDWLRHRKIIQPSFLPKNLAYAWGVMQTETHALIKSIENNTVLNLNRELAILTVNIVGKSFFGMGTQDGTNDLREELEKTQRYGHGLLRMPINYPKWILDVPVFKRLKTALSNVHQIVDDFILERSKTNTESNDLLGLLMNLRYEDTGEKMSFKQVRDEILTLIIAGHETTTLALTWTFYNLARNPRVQELARQEVAGVAKSPEELTHDKLGKLTYLTQVINESLRLYPPAYLFARTAIAEDALGEYYVSPGENIIINLYGLHRNPLFWNNPDEFLPDRFENFNFGGENKFTFMPFGAGPRGCLGTHFAMAEMKIIIGSFLINFEFEMEDKTPIVPKPLFTLNPSRPIAVKFKRITNKIV